MFFWASLSKSKSASDSNLDHSDIFTREGIKSLEEITTYLPEGYHAMYNFYINVKWRKIYSKKQSNRIDKENCIDDTTMTCFIIMLTYAEQSVVRKEDSRCNNKILDITTVYKTTNIYIYWWRLEKIHD